MDKHIEVYVASPAWVYKDSGHPLEHHLSIEFLAEDDMGAVQASVKWARERHEAIMKGYGEGSFFSSIKVYRKRIEAPGEDGSIGTRTWGCIFEWKYDWPGTLEDQIGSFLDRSWSGVTPVGIEPAS